MYFLISQTRRVGIQQVVESRLQDLLRKAREEVANVMPGEWSCVFTCDVATACLQTVFASPIEATASTLEAHCRFSFAGKPEAVCRHTRSLRRDAGRERQLTPVRLLPLPAVEAQQGPD